jgi:hypothetical protein
VSIFGCTRLLVTPMTARRELSLFRELIIGIVAGLDTLGFAYSCFLAFSGVMPSLCDVTLISAALIAAI